MLDGPAITKQLGSNNEKHRFAALVMVSSYLNSNVEDLPLMLVPALETMLRSGDNPTTHRVLMYGLARRSTLLHSSLLAAIISDLEDTTINDPACLSAAASSLPMLPTSLILNFFARPGNEEGSYSCESSAEVISRCLGHENPRVRCGTIPGLMKAAIKAFGAVDGTEGLQNHGSTRAHESWAAAVRFRDVVHDHVGELLNKLSNLVAEDINEQVVALAATTLHTSMKGAMLLGQVKHEGDECWDLDGTHFLLVDVMRGIDEKARVGAEWAQFTVQAARSFYALIQKVLGFKESKLNQLTQRTLQSSTGSFAHPSLLRFGSDLVILKLYLQSVSHFDLKRATSDAHHWASTVLAKEACGESVVWEEALVGISELLRLLHLPCLRHIRGLLANSIFETSMASTRGASGTGKKETDIAYRPQLYHHISTELLSSQDVSLVACAISALPWCSHSHLLPSRFSRCLRLVCLVDELTVRLGLMSALSATLMREPTAGLRPSSMIMAALGSSQTLDILQDRAPKKLSQNLDTAQLRHELACSLLRAAIHALPSKLSTPVVFRLPLTVFSGLECLRWAEAATVLLTREFRGWKLSDCLSWSCTDDIASDSVFPSAAAPLSFLKLMGLVFTACNQAKLVHVESATSSSEADETMKSEIKALEENIHVLQARHTEAKEVGELEISQALQATLAEEQLRRNELLKYLRSPREQWVSGWNVITEEMTKLSRDLIVWTLGRGIKDRGVRVALLALLADQWKMLSEKREVVEDMSITAIETPETVENSADLNGSAGKWDIDSFGRSHSAGRSDQSLSHGDSSFGDDCDDMSFSEGALSEDLARELIRELSRVDSTLKLCKVEEDTSRASKGLIGGGSCARAIAPPSAVLPYHQVVVAACLRLSDTSPRTAPLFLAAFTSRITNVRYARCIALDIKATLGGFEDAHSEIDPLLMLLNAGCSHIVQRYPALEPVVKDESTLHISNPLSSESQRSDAFSDSSMDFFAAASTEAITPVSRSLDVSTDATPPRPSSSQPSLETLSSTELMHLVLSICDRGYAFADRYYHCSDVHYGMALVEQFESQLNNHQVQVSRLGPLLSTPVGGCGDPLVGHLSARVVGNRVMVQLVLHNTAACPLVGVGGRLCNSDVYSIDTLPSCATVRFDWQFPTSEIRSITAQVFFRNLELEGHSDSEEEVEDAFNDADEDVDDFGGDGFSGGDRGGNIPLMVKTYLPVVSLQIPATMLLVGARLSTEAFLSKWALLPHSRHVHASSTHSLESLPSQHSDAFVPSGGNSDSMTFYSFAWNHGDIPVLAVLSAIYCENSVSREVLDVLEDIRVKLNLSTMPPNETLMEVVKVTGITPTSDVDRLVRRVAASLQVPTTIQGANRWEVEIQVRCSDSVYIKQLMEGESFVAFLGRGKLRLQGGSLTLAKGSSEIAKAQDSMLLSWRKLKEQRKFLGLSI